MQEEIYHSIGVEVMKDFGNVFRSTFLKEHKNKIQIFTKVTKETIDGSDISRYKSDKDLILVYDYEPGSDKSLVFRFTGNGMVNIDRIIRGDEKSKISIVAYCSHGGNSTRQRILHKIYRELNVNVLGIDL